MARDYSALTIQQNRLLDDAENLKNELGIRNDEYMVFHNSTKNTYQNSAQTDAKDNLPSDATAVSSPLAVGVTVISEKEQQIIADYENKFHDLTDKATSTISRLIATFKTEFENYEVNPSLKESELKRESESQQSNDTVTETQRYSNEILNINKEKSRLESEFQKDQKRFEYFTKKYGREMTDGSVSFIRDWKLEAAVLIFLSMVEIPFNKVVFDHIVSSTVESYVFAAATGLFIMLGAHYAGMGYKRHQEKGKLVFSILISFLLLGVCWAVGVFRYMDVHNIKFSEIDKVKVSMLLKDFSFWFFFLMSLIVAIVGIVTAFNVKDSSGEFEHGFKEFDKAQQEFDKGMKDWNIKIDIEEDKHIAIIAKINVAHSERLSKIPDILSQGLNIYQDFKSLHNGMVRVVNELEDAMIKGANETASGYRATNTNKRSDKTTIPSFWKTTYSLKFEGEDILKKYSLIS